MRSRKIQPQQNLHWVVEAISKATNNPIEVQSKRPRLCDLGSFFAAVESLISGAIAIKRALARQLAEVMKLKKIDKTESL
jgi:hypothetical protein